MSLLDFLRKKKDEEIKSTQSYTKRVIHQPRIIQEPPQSFEGEIPWDDQSDDVYQYEDEIGEDGGSHEEEPAQKFQRFMEAMKKAGPSVLPRKYRLRTAIWDFSSILSLVVNAILLALILLMTFRIHTLENTITGLLGGLYDNFVRMDRSYISTTVTVDDMPIPLDFTLPVSQDETNVTLTRDVTIRNAYVDIDTGQISISAPATVTLPKGTTLPVTLQMEVPVQTTVLVDLQVPINIELAHANSSDPSVANLHTAFLGLQDTIGPLYCLLQPDAQDYLLQPLCNIDGLYIHRTPSIP